MTPELQKIYTKRVEGFREQVELLASRSMRLSLLRLLIFIVGIGLGIYLFAEFGAWVWIYIVLFLFGFSRFIFYHQRIQQAKQFNESLVRINELELRSLAGDHSGYDAGTVFQDADHPYSIDLDIFGDNSLFQFINRSQTFLGKNRLAEYLRAPADMSEIRQRQAAVRELQSQLDWRQKLQAWGEQLADDPAQLTLLNRWLDEPDLVKPKKWLQLFFWVNPLLIIAGIYLSIFHVHWLIGLLFALPALLIIRNTLEAVGRIHQQTTHSEKTLAGYARLIAHIEKGNFKSDWLQQLQSDFRSQPTASAGIRRLSYIIQQLNARYNFFAFFLNLFGLWDLQWIYQLEKWKARYRSSLPQWFAALGQFEAISSLAGLAYNRPEWCLPEIEESPRLEASDIGHPLIDPAKMIGNDFASPTDGHIKLVTGSNMAGKSTFLRTIGINIVLALAGSVVCARRFRLPILQVYTSMRTQDALHESTSSFYAELKRLKTIIEAVESQPNIYFLLDEILKGTNSNDRHTGSKALIRQLIVSGGAGIIATHDLELGQLEAQYEGAIENLCIEVEIEDGQLHFDYKIKPGVSQSFNATLLMRQMGIRV